MTHPSSRHIAITRHDDRPALSKSQIKFNRLMKKIAEQKQQLVEWQEAIPLINERMAREYDPGWNAYFKEKKQLVMVLETWYLNKALKGKDKTRLKDVFCAMAVHLLLDEEDEELKAIYNRHNKMDFDSEMAAGSAALKELVGDELGIDLSGVDFEMSRSPEETLQRLMEAAAQQAGFEHAQASRPAEPPKKTKKQLQREAKQESARQEIGQSIREVFRKLVGSLHPDREPDEKERDRKTALMQKVNVAYERRDLLALLSLQLEIEQIDQNSINMLSETRLKHYIQVLSEQSTELQHEIREVQSYAVSVVGEMGYGPLTPNTLMREVQQKINLLQVQVNRLKRDRDLLIDVNAVKSWLRINYNAVMEIPDEHDYF